MKEGAPELAASTMLPDRPAPAPRVGEVLRESAELFQQLMHNVREVFWVRDPARGQMIYINPAYEEIWGRTCQSLYASPQDWLAAVHPEDQARVSRAALQLAASGEYHEEYRIVRPDGATRWIQDRAFPVRDEFGRLYRIVGIAQDITERKRLEQRNTALAALAQRLGAATSPPEAGRIILDVAAELFDCDGGCVHLYAPAEEQLIPLLVMRTEDGRRQPFPACSSAVSLAPTMRRVIQDGARLTHQPDLASLPADLVPLGGDTRPACLMQAPIRFSSVVQGVLSVVATKLQAYSEADLRLLQTLADQCGDALQRIKVAVALRQAEANYRSIFENATEGVFQTTPLGRYLSANPALARMLGYESPEELLAQVTDIERQTYVQPERREELKRLLDERGAVQGFEVQRRRKDGSTLWMSINSRAVRDARGALLYYEGTNRDITARKQAEAVLRESERKLRLITENTTDVIFAFNMERQPVYANAAVEKLTGYTFAEIQKKGFINWIHPDDRERMLKLWEELYAGKGYSDVEFRLRTKTGQMKWCSSTWGPLFDETGRQIGVQGCERDITERKELEREVLESSANEQRRIGHDLHDGLGQYLAGISFRAKALEEALAAAGSPHAGEAKEVTGLIGQAISQTRSLARGLDPIEVEASGLVAPALQNLALATEELFKVTCRFHCPDSTLRVGSPIGVALYRIAQEAIHNAATHGQAHRIQIELKLDADHLCLSIQDDGTGFQVTKPRRTGMGLRLMNYRASSIGASLRISSRPRHGTKVHCLVPRALVRPRRRK